MKTYVDRNFNRNYVKGVDLQQVGVYYNIPIQDIYKEKRKEFDYEEDELENGYVLIDRQTIDSGEYVENFDNIEYDYTDEVEIDDYLKSLMNYKQYKHYLVVLFNARWTNASGYKFFDNYTECFYRDYDNTMYVKGSSRSGKYLKLKEYHHDKPMGHDSIIIGLTDTEYEKLQDKNIDDIINYGYECLGKIENFD